MAQATAAPHPSGFLSTLRKDRWWVEPALVVVSLGIFFGWLTISIFLDTWAFQVGPYLSPVFEPKLWDASDKIWLSPGMVVVLGPVPFRATCYYYRGAYYRSAFLSPAACAVGDIGKSYTGESRFPFILQNAHRFFMYAALLFVPILWWGAFESFGLEFTMSAPFIEENHIGGFGIGLGSVFLVLNAFLLSMYTLSCHSLRHFVGGSLNCFSCSSYTRTRKTLWNRVTDWNARHKIWAWSSLLSIVGVDLYIRLVANEVITDLNTWDHF